MSSTGAAFSYAQAAKGLAPSIQNTSSVSSSTPSEHGGPPAVEMASEEKTKSPVPETNHVDQEQANAAPAVTTSPKVTNPERPHPKDRERSMESLSSTKPSTTSPADGTEGAAAASPDATLEAGEKRARGDADNDKGKDTDDDWDKVSVPSVAAEKELKAAPIPVVNIWQQRKEAQDAKFKDVTVQRSATAVPVPRSKPPVTAVVDESKRKPNQRDADRDDSTGHRRTNNGPRASTERKNSAQVSPRSQAQQDTKSVSPLQPVADTESWPTPDTSIAADDRRRLSIVEKADKVEAKSAAQKKWVQMPFVPTAKFETQLPPAAARRGGRPANRGRDGGARGGFNAHSASTTEKGETGAMAPPPLPYKPGDQDRGRKNAGYQNSRASSVPSQANRAPSHESYTRDPIRFSVPHARDSVENTSSRESLPIQSTSATVDGSSVTTDSGWTSRNPAVSSFPAKVEADRREIPASAAGRTLSGQSHNAVDHGGRSQVGDRTRGAYQDGGRASYDQTERGSAPSRDWSRSRSDLARDKGDTWRTREPRPERGRGGYRGRGNHAGYSSHTSPTSYTIPPGQTGFDPTKPPSVTEGRSNRQASQPYAQAQSMSSARGNPRSQSIPVSNVQGGYYGPMQGFPQALSPTEMNFAPYQQVPGSIMSSMPYADQLNSYALISMVITQLEYYFSIDNLCKDMFLRKNMDSQGFVPLGVIANFKRIKALTDGQMSADQLRSVCQQVRNVEFVTGEDGEDKLRSRENWRDFVLPKEERLTSAQNDGPAMRTPSQPAPHAPEEYAGTNGSARSPAAGPNGFPEFFNHAVPPAGFSPVAPFDGTGEYSFARSTSQSTDHARKPSTTSPFSNVQSPPAHEHVRSPSSYMTNGHRPSRSNVGLGDNVFPDEKIPELKVVVRDPAYEANHVPGSLSPGAKQETPALRGGAGSPDLTKRFQTLQFGQPATSAISPESDQPPYWTKDGEIGQIPTGPGFVHEDYLPLREKALSQRLDSHRDGALRVLYAFWSSFLVEHFNLSMYEEFATLANEDLQEGDETGRTYLVHYYDTLLTSRSTMSDRIAADIVKVAREETGDRRVLWHKLRTAWRNGATNLKTRKRLGDALNEEEKTELDRTA